MFVGSLDLGAHLSRNESSSRILVGICGIPASGKTTLALNVVERINSSYQKPPAEAVSSSNISANHLQLTPESRSLSQ